MQKPSREHGPSGANRVSMRDGAALDVHDLRRQTELLDERECDRRERLVDFRPLDVGKPPTGSLQRLTYGWHGAESEHARLDGPGES